MTWKEIDDYVPVTFDRAISILRQVEQFAVADWLVSLRHSNEPGKLRDEIKALQHKLNAVQKRLDHYEPPAPERPYNDHRAGPMSDG